MITRKEYLAVILAIKKFKPFIAGTHFYVITDAHRLCYLMRIKRSGKRMLHWQLALLGQDFEVIHRKGSDNVIPDFQSRSITKIAESFETDSQPEDFEYKDLFESVQLDPDRYPDYRIQGNELYKHVPIIVEEGGFTFSRRQYVKKNIRENLNRDTHITQLCHLDFYIALEFLRCGGISLTCPKTFQNSYYYVKLVRRQTQLSNSSGHPCVIKRLFIILSNILQWPLSKIFRVVEEVTLNC